MARIHKLRIETHTQAKRRLNSWKRRQPVSAHLVASQWPRWPDLTASQSGIFNLYRDLIHSRRNWFNNTRGLRGQNLNVHHVNPLDKVIGFHRWDQGGAGGDVVVVLNLANRAYDNYGLGFPREGRWRVRFNSDWIGYSSDFGNHASFDTLSTVGPHALSCGHRAWTYTAVILSQ